MTPSAAAALRSRRLTRLLPAACASLLLLWGCGGDPPPTPTPPQPTATAAPTAAPAERTIFVDVSDAAGIDFVHDEFPWLAVPQGGGIVAFDYNRDGNADFFIANSNGPNVLYRNNGDGTFTDVAASAGVADPDGRGNGGCSADYDNDGDADLYITNYGTSRLFENRGDGTFVESSAKTGIEEPYAGLRSTGCSWGDYDADGAIDLVVVRHIYENRSDMLDDPNYMVAGLGGLILYHNAGDGSFTNETALLGDLTPPVEGVPGVDEVKVGNIWGAGFQPSWLDYDNDGDVDLYVVNDFGRALHANVLWRNDGPAPDGGWSFVDVSTGSGADVEIYGMSMSVGDYDHDGFFDIFITDIRGNVLLRNDGNGRTFTDLAEDAGVNIRMIGRRVRVNWGSFFFDFDNDSYLDLYIVSGYLGGDTVAGNPLEQPNTLMRNEGDGTFTDVSWISGADDPGVGRGSVYLDYDNDGCLDLLVANLGQRARLFRNACEWGNNWLAVDVVGTHANRDGLGARLELEAGGRLQIREVATGHSHMGQNVATAHFGLADAPNVDSLTVRWPNGAVQTLTDLPPNRRITLTEPE